MTKPTAKHVTILALLPLLAACGDLSGSDFTIESEASNERLIRGFSALETRAAHWPLEWPQKIRLRLEKPSANELLFKIHSSESEAGSSFHLRFSEGDATDSTRIDVDITVPEVGELSESMVENEFRETSKVLADDIANNRSSELIGNVFSAIFYNVAMQTNPVEKKALESAPAAELANEGEGEEGEDGGWGQ